MIIDDVEFVKFEDGPFKEYFGEFIIYKRSKGQKVARSSLVRLRQLNNELNSYGILNITETMIEDILGPTGPWSTHVRKEKITLLRQFSDFMRLLGFETTPVSPSYSQSTPSNFRPYIFTQSEINRLIEVADTLPKGVRTNNHIKIYPVLLRILIGTGMRIGEVISLENSDIDIDTGVIKVKNGKNNVSRFIPMSDSLSQVVSNYLELNDQNKPEEPLFTSPYTGTFYSYDAMKYMFCKICTTAEIFTKRNKTPNLHSLRHTFCTQSLEQMLDSGMDLYTAIPILAAYLGHVNLADTERYIHFTAGHYKKFLLQESSLGRLIPEVD